MASFRHLADAEARTLTRTEILGRVEAEQAHWLGKAAMTDADRVAYQEVMQIMYAYLDPADGVAAARDALEGRPNNYWETRPGDEPALRERCVYCGKKDYEPGWGCHTCGTATVEDVAGDIAATQESESAPRMSQAPLDDGRHG